MTGINPQFQAMPSQLQQRPNMTGQFDNTSMAKAMDKSQADKILTLGLTVPAWYGLSKLNKLTQNASACEYEKSLIGKIAKFGDGIAVKPWVTKVGTGFDKIGKYWTKLVDKSKVLSAMVKTPSVPGAACARDMAKGAVEEVFTKIFDI